MIIDLFSDLHLDSYNNFYPKQNSDVCVLAGDLCNGPSFNKHIQHFINNYTTVIYVSGNHEYYERSTPNHSLAVLSLENKYSHFYPLNIYEKGIELKKELEDYIFFGRSLWWDDKMNPLEELAIRDQVNDLKYIEKASVNKLKELGKKNKEELNFFLQQKHNKKVIIITHHAPCTLSVSPEYKGHVLTKSFVNDCSDMIINHKPYLWVHGHTHNSANYVLEDTTVVCNPLGTSYFPNKNFMSSSFNLNTKKFTEEIA
jgi:predicted phosphodiesterase